MVQIKIYINGKESLTLINSNADEIKWLLKAIEPILRKDKEDVVSASVLDHENSQSYKLFEYSRLPKELS
tara:strand:+ start:76 stop:285 length:210 start_codon:yes stop_codon:yes gene_type:complete